MIKWKFKAFLAIYSLIFIILIIAAGRYVWKVLAKYQADYEREMFYGNPDNVMMEYMRDFTAENIYEMIDRANYAYTIYENSGTLKKRYEEIPYISDDIRYRHDKAESTDRIKRYNIFAGEEKAENLLAYINLEKDTGLGKFGFPEWQIADAVLIERFKADNEIIIRVPSNLTITVNGTAVSRDNIYTGEMSGIDESFAILLGKYTGGAVEYVNYKFDKLYAMPKIVVKDETGNEIPYRYTSEKIIEYGNFAGQEFIDAMLPTVQQIETAYGDYMIQYRDFNALSTWLIPESELYNWIKSSEIRWNTPPYSVRYDRWEISNVVIYNDDCFTCDIYYYQNSDYGAGVFKEYENNFKSIFVRIDGGWKLAYQKNK